LGFARCPESGTEKLPSAVPLFPVTPGRYVRMIGVVDDSFRLSTTWIAAERLKPGDWFVPVADQAARAGSGKCREITTAIRIHHGAQFKRRDDLHRVAPLVQVPSHL